MLKAVAKYLELAATEIGLDCEIVDGYSGRGMYGEETIAVRLDNSKSAFFQIIAVASLRVQEDEHSNVGDDDDDEIDDWKVTEDGCHLSSEEFVAQLGEINVDTIGKNGVLYY